MHDAHKAVADASQGALLEVLKARGIKTRPLWISNSILARGGTLALAEELAARADVRAITVDAAENAVHDA